MGDLLQYSVVLTEGDDADLKRWVWVERERIGKILENMRKWNADFFCYGMSKYGVGGGTIKICGESIEIRHKNEEGVNSLVSECCNFPQPFVKVGGEYVLNRQG